MTPVDIIYFMIEYDGWHYGKRKFPYANLRQRWVKTRHSTSKKNSTKVVQNYHIQNEIEITHISLNDFQILFHKNE